VPRRPVKGRVSEDIRSGGGIPAHGCGFPLKMQPDIRMQRGQLQS
jgi:hypothetical protein